MQRIKNATRRTISHHKQKTNGDAGGFAGGKELRRALCPQAATAFVELANHIFNKLKRMVALTPSMTTKKDTQLVSFFVVGDAGFGPAKSSTTDLQSAPFGRSGNPPYKVAGHGAGERSRTINLLITNQLLCH